MPYTIHIKLGSRLFKTTHLLIRRIYDFLSAHLYVNDQKEKFNSVMILDFQVFFVNSGPYNVIKV